MFVPPNKGRRRVWWREENGNLNRGSGTDTKFQLRTDWRLLCFCRKVKCSVSNLDLKRLVLFVHIQKMQHSFWESGRITSLPIVSVTAHISKSFLPMFFFFCMVSRFQKHAISLTLVEFIFNVNGYGHPVICKRQTWHCISTENTFIQQKHKNKLIVQVSCDTQ